MTNFDFNGREEKTLKELCSQNRYKDSKEYYSYSDYLQQFKMYAPTEQKTPIKSLCESFARVRKETTEYKQLSARNIQMLGLEINLVSVLEQYPVFYVNSNLLQMLDKTKYPCQNVLNKLFLENVVLLFPKDNKWGIQSCTVSSSYMQKINQEYIFEEQVLIYDMEGDICTTDDEASFFAIFVLEEGRVIAPFYWGSFTRKVDNNTVNNVKRLDYCVFDLLLQLFLYMSTTYNGGIEEIITPTNIHNTTPKKNRKFGLLTPPTIGKECSEYVRKQKAQYSEHKGSHASPITHWRRGHWRNQTKIINGEKGKELIWIRPTIINPLASA